MDAKKSAGLMLRRLFEVIDRMQIPSCSTVHGSNWPWPISLSLWTGSLRSLCLMRTAEANQHLTPEK